MVIDNIDDANVVFRYLPEIGPQKHTLITTRNPQLGWNSSRRIGVPLLDIPDLIDLPSNLSLIDISNSAESVQASRIVEESGWLSLRIEQVDAYAREIAVDFATFLDDIHKNHEDVHQWVL